LKITKIIIVLTAWYAAGFYLTVESAYESSMAELRVSSSLVNPTSP
jgi:hypothetical protein